MSIRRAPLVRQAGDIEIGDNSFDKKFFVEGPVRQVLSLLDAETRRLLICANAESRLEISTGTFRAEPTHDERVPYVLSLLLDIGRRFAGSTDVPRRLAANAQCDPEPGVRLSNLLLLARELPGEPGTIEALRTACADRSPEIRLCAARELGVEGRGVLLELAESLVDDAVSADAVRALDHDLPLERTKAILDQALQKDRLQAAGACLEALGRSGDAAAEAPLLDVLQREPEKLRLAAAEALGRVGSAAAVLPLQEAAERWGGRGLRFATQIAISEIQSRLQGASPGQLSVMDLEAGHLSLAPSEGGELSLTQDETGLLAFPTDDPGGQRERPPEEPGHLGRTTGREG